ncbi:MAG: THUMP domain-containing protein [Candidatus Methanofastidiosia archaeon]
MNCVVIRYGEIGTKSKRTRRRWESLFMKNIRSALKANDIEFSSVDNPRGRIIVTTRDSRVVEVMKDVFGISSISFAIKGDCDLNDMKEKARALYGIHGKGGTFRISTQRLDKQFPLTSQEVNVEVGAYIAKENISVDLTSPDVDIGIEILYDAAYLFVDRVPGYGGIPVGIQGKVLVCLTDERSAVAAWMMLKRGCGLVVYGNEEIRSRLERFSYGHPITRISDPRKARGVLAVVFSEFHPEKRDIPSFFPLLGLNESQIQEIEKNIFG